MKRRTATPRKVRYIAATEDTSRWRRAYRLAGFKLELSRFVNRQCLALGLTLNWNFRPSVEIDFLLWRLYLEYSRSGAPVSVSYLPRQ